MAEAMDTVNNPQADNGSTTDTSSESETNRINTNNITMGRGENTGRRGARKRKGMEKMIVVGARISAQCGELIQNPRGSQYRRVRERLFGKVISSIGENKYKILLDNGIEKDIHSNALRLEESSAGIPLTETSEEAAVVDNEVNEETINNIMDEEETEDVVFPMDSADIDPVFEETYEEDDGMNDEAAINIGDINVPADTDELANTANNDSDNPSPQTYHQKLEAKRKAIKELIGTEVSKSQKNLAMNWKVIEESVPEKNAELADLRDSHYNKIGFNNLLEFLHKYGYEENNSCSFESCTSSNVDRKTLDPNKSIIFAELFLKMMYKNWEDKLLKMNRYIEDYNVKNEKKTIRVFDKSEFIIGHALIIGAACYCQSGSVLFSNGKDKEDSWDSIMMNARFDRYMKLYRFKEFRYYLPKVFELPMEKETDPWWAFSSAIKDFNDIRKDNVTSSWKKILDELMSAWRPRTTKNGGLPNISYIIRKPEPLGTEFKSVCDPVTGVVTHLEIQRGEF